MKQDRILQVCVGEAGIEVGTLWLSSQAGRVYSAFRYSPAWLEHPKRFALSPDLALSMDRKFFHAASGIETSALPPPLADTVPDAWGRKLLRNAHEQSGSSLDEFDYLVAVDDSSRIGALRIREIGSEHFLAQAPSGRPPVPSVVQIHNLVRDIHQIEQDHPDREALQRLLGGGSSLGGARPKCVVIDEKGAPTIAKFTSRFDTHPVEKAEVLALRLARICGLDAPNVRLLESNGFPVALIDRFDRSAAGRIPYLSAQSFMGLPSALGGTYIDFAEHLREFSREPEQALRELFGRVSYSILISNTDDHLKNHALLYDGRGDWKLSPVFDVNPVPERENKLKTAIADPSEADASISLLIDHSEFFGISKDDAAVIAGVQAELIEKNWKTLAKDCGMTSQEVHDYKPAFVHKEMQLAIQMKGKGLPIVP